jgi:hypothetical protein
LETYAAVLDDQTTIVFAADSPLLKLLTRGLPSLQDDQQPAAGGSMATDKQPRSTAPAAAMPVPSPGVSLPASPVRAQEALR